jgi:hypothetical protein
MEYKYQAYRQQIFLFCFENTTETSSNTWVRKKLSLNVSYWSSLHFITSTQPPHSLQKTLRLSHRSVVADIMVCFPCSVNVIFRKTPTFLCPWTERFVKQNVSLCVLSVLRINYRIQHNYRAGTHCVCWDIQGNLNKDMPTNYLLLRSLFWPQRVHGTGVADGPQQTSM